MKLLVLDGNSIINRAFYGIRLLSTKDGLFTNGIYGFMNILLKLKDDENPDVIAAAFDLRAPTFRHESFSEYKAGRKSMPEELAMQFPILKELLKQFGCIVLEKEGFEADDILGTLSDKAQQDSDECVIATGDRDSLQLVNEKVKVLLAATKMGKPEVTVYNSDKILEEYGVTPPQMIEIKALQGDASDNIPGVAGVGAKTAGSLIQQFNSIDYIYENIDTIDIKDNLREKLKAGREKAFLSKQLGTICKTVPVELPCECSYKQIMDKPALKGTLTKLEMFKLIERLGLSEVESIIIENNENATPVLINESEIIVGSDKMPDNSVIYYDEKSGVLAAKNQNKYYIYKQNIKDCVIAKNLIIHDSKAFYHALNLDFCPDITFDTMLAAYLLNPDQNDYSLDRYAIQYPVAKHDNASEYSDILYRLDVTDKLFNVFSEKINEYGQAKLLSEVEVPLAYTLYLMEKRGFLVDEEGIKAFGEKLSDQVKQLEKEIFSIIGYEFNLNSPKQLGEALFEKLGLPHSKKTKTGYSTNAEVLESLRYESDAVELLLEYRSVTKLKSTYCDGLLKVISDDGRIHSTLKQTETRTGRISSAEPNLQNIPVRTPLGREMRRFFIAKDGYILVDADYSQIELRVLASIANDETMCNAFLNNDDIHSITASQVFNIPLEMMTSDIRNKAKAVNFGIVYGIGAFSLSKSINVSVAQAKRYIDDYLSTYSGVNDYMNETVEQAKQNGYVTTAFGRRRYLPELSSSNFNRRSFSERVARNMPIQGTAADIIKIAMIRVQKRLLKENLKAKLIMQVHDELICEAPDNEKDLVEKILKEEMQSAVDFKVPMIAEVKSAKTWYDAK